MKHPPCQVCGCQNQVQLANLIAEAVLREQARRDRIEDDLAIDHVRGPAHNGQHEDCLVCAAIGEGALA